MTIEPYKIGKTYLIPTVEGEFYRRIDVWPVLGPYHEDEKHIGFPHYHYHFDFRFFNKTQWKCIMKWAELRSPLYRLGEWQVYSGVLLEQRDKKLGPVVYRRRKCLREMPDFVPDAFVPWFERLRDAYRDHKLTDAMVCPHKGASLKGLPIVNDCVVCPLHGLRWNLRTRRLDGVEVNHENEAAG